jgi:hypothetical protein
VLAVVGCAASFPASTSGAAQQVQGSSAAPPPRSVPPVGTLLATLHDPDATSGDSFGLAVARFGLGVGAIAVVGAPGVDASAGAAYIYTKGSSGWPTTPTATLTDPAATSNDYFGWSVAVSGNTALVSSPYTDSNTGAAYIYVRGSSGWPTTPTATLTGAASNDYFGGSVAVVSGGAALVGAGPTDNGVGAAYLFRS